MTKCSTLFYSIHNLSSKIEHEIVNADVLNTAENFMEIENVLNQMPLQDVRQDIVDRILYISTKI